MLPLCKEKVFVLTNKDRVGNFIRAAKKRGFKESRPIRVGSTNGLRHVTIFLEREERSAA